jgi:4-hydroxy-4-methyl-2-oxoglutarate aldolase
MLTAEQLAALMAIDTPTLCNAIEKFRVRNFVDGFMGMDIRCLTPSLGVMVGYAVTMNVDSTTPDVRQSAENYRAWLEAMAAAPKPAVLVLKDVGPNPRRSCHFGDVMATLSQRLGVVGLVTDGGVRDVLEVERMGFHFFAAGLVPSHGNPRLLEVNVPVTIDGVTICPGDLLHGDVHGVTTVPLEIAVPVVEAAHAHLAAEAATKAFIQSADFTIDAQVRRRFPQ